MGNKSRIERLIDFYDGPGDQSMPEDLETFQEQLDYCRDLMLRYRRGVVWKMLVKHFEISRGTAYNLIDETKRFFARDFSKDDRAFETAISIERLERIRKKAYKVAKSTRDFYYCAKIDQQINELKGLFSQEEEFDIRLLKPSVIQLVIPTNGRPKTLDAANMDSKAIAETIDLVEGVDFSVDKMEKEILKIAQNESAED